MRPFNPDKKPTESKEETKHVHNVFSLTEAEKETLRIQTLENQGIARIMVHPYYVQQNKNEKSFYSTGRVDIVESGFEQILKTKYTTPVFLFESHGQVANTTKKIVPMLIESGSEVYIVPTLPHHPMPYNSIPHNPDKITAPWPEFIRLLKRAGVKKLIIGGMHLKELSLKLFEGCVGITINELRGDFEIQVSSISSPQSRKDVTMPDIK